MYQGYVYLCDEHYRRSMVEYTMALMPGLNKCDYCGKDATHMTDIKDILHYLLRLIDGNK